MANSRNNGGSLTTRTIVLLALSSVVNGGIGLLLFLVWGFGTNPTMSDVPFRIAWYVLPVIILAAAVATVFPWILAGRSHGRSAVVVATLPITLSIVVVLAFLLLDSWLNRTFG